MHSEPLTTTADLARGGIDPAEACTLPPDALEARIAWVEQTIVPRIRAVARRGDAFRCRLEGAPGLEAALDRWIELEAACCGGMTLSHHADAGERVLVIGGVDPEAPIFAGFMHSEGAMARPRIGRALGVGTFGALLVCCVLPAAVAGLFGAAAAAPLATLDRPLWIVVVGVATAGAFFAWQRRRGGRVVAPPEEARADGGCGCPGSRD